MNSRIALQLSVLAFTAWAGLTPPAPAADGFQPNIFTNATGQTLPYRLLVPADYSPARKYPVVLFFHGAGERGTDNEKQLVHGTSLYLKAENRSAYPCLVIAPQCPADQQWVDMPWGTDSGQRPAQPSAAMQLALQALDGVIATFSVDTNRIYATGLSMGGYATWDCVTRFPNRFAAGAPICGGGDEATITPAVARVPVWAFHSEDDSIVKVVRTRNLIQALRSAGGQPKYFEYFGLGHFSWGKAYDEPEFLPWMFAQRLGQADTFKLRTPAPELPAVAKWPASDDLFPGQGPLQKADWFRKLWRDRRLQWWMNRQRDAGAVVFLGDSITQGWGSLAKDFPNAKVANRGISGDVTRGVRFRLQEDVLDLHPTAVVLLIGTNDLGLGGDPETTAKNIRALLTALTDHNPKLPVIVCKVMPRAADFAQKIQRLNELVDEFIQGKPQFIRCDTWSLFANDDGGAKKEEFPDLLHPNAAGYAKWAEALRTILAGLKR